MREYYKILEWLYLNDNKFSSAKEWREKFLEELKKQLLFKDEQKIEIVSVEPEIVIKDLLEVIEQLNKQYDKRK